MSRSLLRSSVLVDAARGLWPLAVVICLGAGTARAEATLGASANLAEIEACASRNLPSESGRIEFRVDAIDRSGAKTTSRAELSWRKPDAEPTRILLSVSEPAKTAGTALLIIDRDEEGPEFFVRLPEMAKVKRIRSRRLRGPVLGTDFSYEDLDRLREPLDETAIELVGISEVEGQPAWLLEAIPGEDDDSEYTRVLTFVDQANCLPIRIELFESGPDGADRLRKRLEAPRASVGPIGSGSDLQLPHEFVMHDLRRETRTLVNIEHFETNADLPVERFTRSALQNAAPPRPAAPSHSAAP